MCVSTRIISSIFFRPRQSRPSGGGPCAGGRGCIACDGNGEDECFSTCSHAAEQRSDMAGRRRTGLVRVRWRLRVAESTIRSHDRSFRKLRPTTLLYFDEEAQMLKFNEGKCCDAVVRRLEERQSCSRSDMRWPEQER